MSASLSVEQLCDMRRQARTFPVLVQPVSDDSGRQFYLAYSHRDRMLSAIEPGWTYCAFTFGSGQFVAFEPTKIEEMGC